MMNGATKFCAATLVTAFLAQTALAAGHSAADNGNSDSRGHGVASAVSNGGASERGGARVASGLKGGWGGAAGVSNGPAATPKE